MSSDPTVQNWHTAIIAEAEANLRRSLKSYEKDFITSRGGFIALEMIHDTVRAVAAAELEAYLSSECHEKK